MGRRPRLRHLLVPGPSGFGGEEMRIIDPHCHMISRVTDDYERIALAGIEAVVEPAFWLGSPRTSAGTFIDYFELIIGWETQRARQYGIEHFTCIAMNPREAYKVS